MWWSSNADKSSIQEVEAGRDYEGRNLETLPKISRYSVRKAKAHLELRPAMDIRGNMMSFYAGTLVVKG